MKRLVVALSALFLTVSVQSASATPVCKTGVLCGNACIAKDKVCHKTTTAPAAKPAAMAPSAAAPAAPAPAAAAAAPSAAAPAATAAKKSVKCKNAKGKFVKCSAPGAIPG